jgi:hypothetical protein
MKNLFLMVSLFFIVVCKAQEKNGKHSFKHKSTKNIMDYGDKRYFLYNWQCVVANSHANAEPNNYSPAP